MTTPASVMACAASLLGAVLPAQSIANGCSLRVDWITAAVQFSVAAGAEPFVGAVIMNLSGQQTHYFTFLPPLLTDFVVAGVGLSQDGVYVLALPEERLPVGVMIHSQGVALASGVASSDVVAFVLDPTAP